MKGYIFKTSRLGFRTWHDSDLEGLFSINSDDEVMEFFPGKPSKEDTYLFITRMQRLYADKGFCYFAVENLESNEFIGFIGLAELQFSADFTPCVDIGWRLKQSAWNKGYATEGAKACLNFGFNEMALAEIFSVAPVVNNKSEAVMIKIGMTKVKTFEHPLLLNNKQLKTCILYKTTKAEQQP